MRPNRIALAFLLLSADVAHASWMPNGNPISTAATSPAHQTLASDGAGGFYVTWAEAGNVYVQRMLGDGSIAPGWPANGLAITNSGNADSPFVVLGEDRWALVVWETSLFVRLQWVSPDGNVFPGNPVNVIGGIATGGVAHLGAATDGAGGAYIGWSSSSGPENTTAYVTRVDLAGNFAPPYTASGIALATDMYIQSIGFEPDGAGGIAWAVNSVYDGPFVHEHVHVGSASAGGAVPGTALQFWEDNYEGIATPDGQGGVFAHWTTYGRFEDPDGARLQHVDAAGLKTLPDTLSSPGSSAVLLRDGAGGLYELIAANPTAIEARRHLANGTLAPGWPVTISQKPHVDLALGIVPVTAGFIACWADGATDLDLRAIGLQSNGALAPGWPVGGLPLTALAGDQKNVVVLPSPTEGLFAVWQDTRPGAAGVDLYATRVEVHAPVGVDPRIVPGALAFRSIAPNPARSSVHVELALPGGAPATLELIDVRGRVLQRGQASASTTLATDALPAGLYWLRATQGEASATQRVVIVR